MRYVIDSSVAFKWVVKEIHKDKADLLRDDFRNTVHELLAPDVFPYEVAHALTRAERQRRITIGNALPLWLDVMSTVPQLHPGILFSVRAIEIASSARIGVYDCLYVAFAERENCQFVTADDKLVKNLQARFPFIIHLSSVP